MTILTTAGDGNTPLSPEELRELIPNLATKEELNEWERENILRASEWSARDRTRPLDRISDSYIRKLHEKRRDLEVGGTIPAHRKEYRSSGSGDTGKADDAFRRRSLLAGEQHLPGR